MTKVIRVDGATLDRALDTTHRLRHEGLSRVAFGKFDAALGKTAWGDRCRRRLALVDGATILASAEEYDLDGWVDGRAVRVCGIGSVFTAPAHRGTGHAPVLIEAVLDRAAHAGAALAVFFTHTGMDEDAHVGFTPLPITDVALEVAESPRHGAPMTMIRGGEERDLAAIVAMGDVRATPFRFHLVRNADFVRYAITRRRLLAGLGSSGTRQLHFFIAEEGVTAAAYVVVSVEGRVWTIEECGDRDPSGARVGALLQGLIARERTDRPLSIRGWLPPGFAPPQVAVTPAPQGGPSTDTVMVRALARTTNIADLVAQDVLYWRNDVF